MVKLRHLLDLVLVDFELVLNSVVSLAEPLAHETQVPDHVFEHLNGAQVRFAFFVLHAPKRLISLVVQFVELVLELFHVCLKLVALALQFVAFYLKLFRP